MSVKQPSFKEIDYFRHFRDKKTAIVVCILDVNLYGELLIVPKLRKNYLKNFILLYKIVYNKRIQTYVFLLAEDNVLKTVSFKWGILQFELMRFRIISSMISDVRNFFLCISVSAVL